MADPFPASVAATATRILRLSHADAFTGQYRDATAFMAALGDRMTLAAQAAWGRPGAEIVAVSWIEEIAGRPLDHPIAAVTVKPGDAPLSVERLRAHFRAERTRRDRQGRLP